MVVSLKANRKRILAFLLLAVIVVGACVFLQSRGEEESQPIPGGTNEERVAYLQSFGWQVQEEPAETREVMIPAQFNDVYTAYNVMQQAQGFDLKPYAGEVCTQYLYKVENYPNETEAYATLLVYGEEIIGGDVASAKVDGFMHGFAPDSARFGETGAGSQSQASPAASEQPGATAAPTPAVSGTEGSGADSSAEESAAATPQEETDTAGEILPEEAYPSD